MGKTIIKTPRKLFKVTINNHQYQVYDIEGKEHQGYNDTPKTWWIYYNNETSLSDSFIPLIDSDSWKPYNSSSILRHCWGVRIEQKNTSKYKWNDVSFRNHITVEMYCDGKLIYSFSTNGSKLDFAMAKVQYLQVVLSEHIYDFFEPEKNEGRKIYYKGLPATIKVNQSYPWEISIIPDYTCGLSKNEWWEELKRRESTIPKKDDDFSPIREESYHENYYNDKINWGDALSDQYIDWFRS